MFPFLLETFGSCTPFSRASELGVATDLAPAAAGCNRIALRAVGGIDVICA